MSKFATPAEQLAALKEAVTPEYVKHVFGGELPKEFFKSADGTLMVRFAGGREMSNREFVMPAFTKILAEFGNMEPKK